MTNEPVTAGHPPSAARVEAILAEITRVRVAVCGDFCLDAYWMLDPRGGEVSAETGLRTRAVRRHACSLGGAANVVANLAALRPAAIRAIGVVGDDLHGRELARQLEALGVDTAGIVVQRDGYDTLVYGKPYVDGREDPRMDFGFFNQRGAETERALLSHLERALAECHAVVFNQQVPGTLSDAFIDGVNALLDRHPQAVVVCDTRHYGDRFVKVHRKTNDAEAARLSGEAIEPGVHPALEDVRAFACRLFAESGRPVFVTRGSRGLLTVDRDGTHVTPGIQLLRGTDSVGAGDTVTAAIALCLGAGLAPAEAAGVANFAAAVTVQKLFRTGTASPAEVIAVSEHPDFIDQPELARDIRRATCLPGTEIEACVSPLPALSRVRHAVFDHDGTISTLRQGWEQLMAPMMIRAILGDQYGSAGETLYERVARRVHAYIDRSTGVETLVQMGALAEMVAEFSVVPARDVLDPRGYQAVYAQALSAVVHGRLAKHARGELGLDDVTVKGAVPFLRSLRALGIRLYLASGTNEDEVRREAEALGYADLFDGGIYGATGDPTGGTKRRVILSILTAQGLDGSALAVFGDGPVELREARRRGGAAIGIASDEIRRYGLNAGKRTRLVEAGAHLVLPDFSQASHLLTLMRRDHD